MVTISVDDIKQYLYCNRIPFFNHMFGQEIRKPFLVNAGNDFENTFDINYIRHVLDKAEKNIHKIIKTNTILYKKYDLMGRPDLIAISNKNYVPIEIKYTDNVPKNVFYQLIAYALLVENKFKTSVKLAYVFYGKNGKLKFKRFVIRPSNKKQVIKLIGSLSISLLKMERPNSTENINKCYYCEYKNFCDDVI